jgi:hypothetical protein
LIFYFENIVSAIAFRDPLVVAYNSRTSYLFALPLLLYIETSALTVWVVAWEAKKPIFGNKKIQYGEAPWEKDCFPLFDPRRKSRYVKPSEKHFRRVMLIIWLAGLLVCSLFASFGFFGRNCLTSDNRIISYNMLNQEISSPYTTNDFSNLTIQAKFVSGYPEADYWEYKIAMEMEDGKSFTFSNRDFDHRKEHYQEICLEKMLEIKSFFASDSITIKGERNINKVVDFLSLNTEQAQLLQELFR